MKSVIYLYKSGILSRKDYSLVLKDRVNNITYIPIEQIDTIVVFSDVTMNKRVFSLLNAYRVSILFYNFYGNYIGRFSPKKFVDGKVLVNQVLAYDNSEMRYDISKTMTYSSIKNSLSLLKYYNKKGFQLQEEILLIQDILHEEDYSVDSLLLKEARCKKIYFSCFNKILKKENYSFDKRTKNPPENEVNAMLSYGYALLYGNFLSVLDRSRLHSQISFIHSLTKSNESLQYDLADILKPVIVDRLVLSICRHRELKDEYFEYTENRCYLSKQGVKFFVNKYEMYIAKTIKINNRYYSYRNLISREVHQLSNYIAKENTKYKPYIMRW